MSGRFAPEVGRELGPLLKTFSLAPVRDRTPRRSPAQSVYFGVGCQRLSDRSSWTAPCCRRINVALLPHSRLFVSSHLHAGRQLSLAAPEALWLPSNTRFTQSLHSKARRGGGGGVKCAPKGASVNLSVCLLETSTPPVHGYPSITTVCNMLRYVPMVRWTGAGVGGWGGRLQMSLNFWWSCWKSCGTSDG